MIELRKTPRTNVIWRAAIKLGEGKVTPVKVVNISSGGLLLHCSGQVEAGKEYHLMMEVPSINQASSDRYQVACKVKALHARLSGDVYHIGVTFTEISSLHQNLFEAWLSITTRHDQLV